MQLTSRNSSLDLASPCVMGILNVTPDSFSDGGQYSQQQKAVERALLMVEQGAGIIDIGGESTRPGAEPVSVDQELERVIPVIEQLRVESDCWISIDTSKPEVMQAAITAGANMVNDVCALQQDGAVEMVCSLDVPVCLMHMQGEPRTMQANPQYASVVDDVAAFLLNRVVVCEQAGIKREMIVLDPGFGFGKDLGHNLSLLKHLDELHRLGLPLLIGVSRKSMIGAVLDGAPVEHRLNGSLAAAMIALVKGGTILRVHDVAETAEVVKVYNAVMQAE